MSSSKTPIVIYFSPPKASKLISAFLQFTLSESDSGASILYVFLLSFKVEDHLSSLLGIVSDMQTDMDGVGKLDSSAKLK